MLLGSSDFWDAEDLAIEIGDHLCVWTDGSLEPYPSAGLSVAGAGVYLPAPEQGAIWERLTNVVMLGWIGVVLLCRSLVLFRRFSDQSFVALSWPCRLSGRSTVFSPNLCWASISG